mgnify:CR=1 FL=1
MLRTFFVLGCGWLAVVGAGRAGAQTPSADLATIQRAVVEAIARAEKSVVAIARVQRERPGQRAPLEPRPDPFGNRRAAVLPPPRPTDPDFIPDDLAVGVVIERGGLVLTAAHVLAEESDYYVTAARRPAFQAKVLAADPRSDLAVLAPIEGPVAGSGEWVPMALGNADALQKGEFVVALGNPYAIRREGQPSASWGVVANLARKAPPTPDEEDPIGKSTLHHFGTLIETDARLNMDSSGSPLINLKGEMVGMATAIPSVVGFQASAGYAIPVDATFRRALDALRQGREVEYGFLGIQLGGAGRSDAGGATPGTRVERVIPGLPAARHGLKSGDVILAVNGVAVRDSDELVRQLSKYPLETAVKLALRRGDRQLDLEVPLTKLRVRGRRVVTAEDPPWRGLRVDYATAVQEVYSTAANFPLGEALAVTEVEKDSPAWEAGLRPGSLITHVERSPVRTPKQFRQAVAAKTGPVSIRVVGEGGESAERTIRDGK